MNYDCQLAREMTGIKLLLLKVETHPERGLIRELFVLKSDTTQCPMSTHLEEGIKKKISKMYYNYVN